LEKSRLSEGKENEKLTKNIKKIVKTTKKVMNKTQKVMNKTQKVMTGCFAENNERLEMDQIEQDQPRHLLASKNQNREKKAGHVHARYSVVPKQPKNSFVVREAEGFVDPETYCNGKSRANGIEGMALHHEDAYFASLTAESSRYGEVQNSPYVGGNQALRDLPSVRATKHKSDEENDYVEFVVDDTQSRRSSEGSKVSMMPTGTFISLQRSKDAGERDTIESKERLYRISETSGDDDSEILTYFRPEEKITKSAFRLKQDLPEEPLKQIATLGPSSKAPPSSKVSKLESLFRPVLPALSADDAETLMSYDPYQIKVTESAPSLIESSGRRANPDPFSPSMVSIDSQGNLSPAMTQKLVSDQATSNAEFLFTSDYGKTMLLQRPVRSNRDSAMFSISTLGARSRTSARTKAVEIPLKSSQSVASQDSSRSGSSERRVRFSTDAVALSEHPELSHTHTRESFNGTPRTTNTTSVDDAEHNDTEYETGLEESVETDAPVRGGQWYHTTKDGISAVTPHLRGRNLKSATNSPYLRYHEARNKYESEAAEEPAHTTIDIPAIESKVSDLTDTYGDFGGRTSVGSSQSSGRREDTPEEIQEEDQEQEQPSDSPEMQAHWSYRDGELSTVTPHLKGMELKHATNSPFQRFESAKKKFIAPATKEVPKKSPKTMKPKKSKKKFAVPKKYGGAVSSKIEELNQRVIHARKLRKKNRMTGNPRRYNFEANNHIRSSAILNYKTEGVDVEKINYMGACKFNVIPLDDSSIASSEPSVNVSHQELEKQIPVPEETLGRYTHETIQECDENEEEYEEEYEDDTSKLTADSATIATVLQENNNEINRHHARVSDFTHSTASSGLSNVKKQVFSSSGSFGGSRQSISSIGASTTLSSIMEKENKNYKFRSAKNIVKPTEQNHYYISAPELHLSPTQRTPMQASKWRSLAAAAKEKDSVKKGSSSFRSRRGLSDQSNNRKVPAYVR